ncbi:MAG: SUMF1/EgtB/PvdO family nonheme iron enzyme [Leptospiraceae bacterium]|nr:SUMF1/EgtB/PvdO family nonheme iron enzyme [Leptospiraceae bacterium]
MSYCSSVVEDPKTPEDKQKQLSGEGKCGNAPNNMVCVPEKSISIAGATKTVSTFYIDKYEITNASYQECVKEKGCKPNTKINSKDFESMRGLNQPAIPLTYSMAHDFCKWSGKRLPTEAEWQSAYEFSEPKKEITCASANVGNCNPVTKDVGSYSSAGMYDLQGNAPEWVNEWVGNCKNGNCSDTSCEQVCIKTSICSGRFPCEKLNTMLVKGGGFYTPIDSAKPESRLAVNVDGEKEKIGARCVSSSSYLTNAPGWMISNPPKAPKELPGKLSEKEVSMLHNLEAYDTLDKPFCSKPYTSPIECRDPVSYVKTNEARSYLFAPYIKNLRGGYVGVAADSNYTFIAHAKSEFVWLMDFDFVIINLHKMIRAYVLESPTPNDFAEKFNPRNKQASLEILRRYYPNSPDLGVMERNQIRFNESLYGHYKSLLTKVANEPEFGWLRNKEAYDYIRHLYQMNRISIHGGDLTKNKTLFSIGESAKRLGVKIRILYPSNAEEFWKFGDGFRKSILNLPFDEGSVVIRTIHEYPWHVTDRKGGASGFWHHVIHGAKNYQKKLLLPDYNTIDQFKNDRIFPTEMQDLSTIDLPSSIPFKIE